MNDDYPVYSSTFVILRFPDDRGAVRYPRSVADEECEGWEWIDVTTFIDTEERRSLIRRES